MTLSLNRKPTIIEGNIVIIDIPSQRASNEKCDHSREADRNHLLAVRDAIAQTSIGD